MPVALVTGAARSIGRGIALRLANDGFQVAINDLSSTTAELVSLQDEIRRKGRDASLVPADVKDESDVKRMIAKATKDLGSIDVMVANAGVIVPKSIWDTSGEEWDNIMAVNVRGTLFCYKYTAKQMVEQGRGGRSVMKLAGLRRRGALFLLIFTRIIGASSVAGLQSDPYMSAYAASKFAIRGITQAAAKEWGPHGITVNTYAPGFVKTLMLDALALKPEGIADYTPWSSRSVLGTVGDVEDVAGMVSYLAGPDGKWVTGQTLSVNGGLFCT